VTLQQRISTIDLTQIRAELFKRGQFDFICLQDDKEHVKQREALEILTDQETQEFAYGGAAGGAKSWTGAAWATWMCLAYPGIMGGVGRRTLKSLRESTLITFRKVFKKYRLLEGIDWKYNGQDHFIHFLKTDSYIYFVEMDFQPRDPEYERFGSKEYTFFWVEEAGEISLAAYDTIKTRVGRQLNDKYGIVGKLFITLNPKKNWIHQYFWKPFKEKKLLPAVKFLQALVQDNPFVDSGYIDKLRAIKDKVRKQRLLYGNFDYDDDENALMTYDAIENLFTNAYAARGTKYLTVDVARFGKDESRIYKWDGWFVAKRWVLKKKNVVQVAQKVKEIATAEKIPMSQVIADEDGVGGGVVDILKCKGFVNGSSPLENPKNHEKEHYENLATQCGYMAATCVTDGLIGFAEDLGADTDFVEKFSEEAEQVKKRDADTDGKLKLVKKEDVKELIGRSPDDWDTFKMRQWFELKPKRRYADASY
jgi:phage terminase large subunit